jgi:virginiamycin B lyase
MIMASMRRRSTMPAACRLVALVIALAVLAACQSNPAVTPTGSSPAAPASPAATRPAAATSSASPAASGAIGALTFSVQAYPVTAGAHPHDVAVASDGGIWYTGQANGTLGWLDPATGEVREAKLPGGAAPHGVISGPDGAAWVTDQGLDAIVRVTPGTFDVDVFPAPGVSPHTAAFDRDGVLWFTGAAGYIGRLDPATRKVDTYPAPQGAGPYGIAVTPSNDVWFVSLQQSYLGKIDRAGGAVEVIEPPTAGAGTRRVWSDSAGRLWVSYWNAGKVARYDPAAGAWQEWDLPGEGNQAYSMYVDELDAVWLTDFGQNAIVRFDPSTQTFESFPSDRPNAAVRQMLGRPGEAWGAESGQDRLVVVRYAVVAGA